MRESLGENVALLRADVEAISESHLEVSALGVVEAAPLNFLAGPAEIFKKNVDKA
jgi:hypothetical protein